VARPQLPAGTGRRHQHEGGGPLRVARGEAQRDDPAERHAADHGSPSARRIERTENLRDEAVEAQLRVVLGLSRRLVGERKRGDPE
jgi:hypothetical protein